MSDLTKYTQARAARDPEFADGLEAGYTDFKVGARLRSKPWSSPKLFWAWVTATSGISTSSPKRLRNCVRTMST
jgi:hypothetical protein